MSHFQPIDLGHGTATEWGAADLAKILRKTYSSHPKLKKCFLGLIHSHHSMGAFFSGTDSGTLKDMAPDIGFYCSLVVASEKDPFAFAISYKDQYGQAQLLELDESNIVGPTVTANPEWIEIADGIEKDAKPKWDKTAKQQSFLGAGYGYGVQTSATQSVDYTEVQTKAMDLLVDKMASKGITWWEFKSECKVLGTNPDEYWADQPQYAEMNGYGHYR